MLSSGRTYPLFCEETTRNYFYYSGIDSAPAGGRCSQNICSSNELWKVLDTPRVDFPFGHFIVPSPLAQPLSSPHLRLGKQDYNKNIAAAFVVLQSCRAVKIWCYLFCAASPNGHMLFRARDGRWVTPIEPIPLSLWVRRWPWKLQEGGSFWAVLTQRWDFRLLTHLLYGRDSPLTALGSAGIGVTNRRGARSGEDRLYLLIQFCAAGLLLVPKDTERKPLPSGGLPAGNEGDGEGLPGGSR